MQAELNGHAVGIILKELVRRAMTVIRNERQVFEATAKRDRSGSMDDVFTSADTKAQQVYIRSLRECFPDNAIVAEESDVAALLEGPVEPGAFFTVDPLDGTKAFVRRQSHGVGTMVALVEQGRVVSAYVGDINTQEIYGYRPDSRSVHRISEYETSERLAHTVKPISEQYALLRDPPQVYSRASRALLQSFKSYEVEGGSIGIWLARLWKREAGAALLLPTVETPWDMAPIVGISKMLGYRFYRPVGEGWRDYEPVIDAHTSDRDHDVLVIHERDVSSLQVFPQMVASGA
jgi:fructose-1,6-bisphosphatase/inositol monophosphatase family enzyme